MCQNFTKKTILKKNLIAKKKIRVFDVGGKKLITYQKQFRRWLERYLKREQARYIAFLDTIPELKIAVEKSVIVSLHKVRLSKSFEGDFQDATKKFVAGAMVEGVWNFIKEQQTDWIKLTSDFGLKNEQVELYAKTRAGQMIKGLDQVTKERVQSLISQAIQNGEGVGTIKKKLQGLYSFSKYRAGLIASTELGQAYSEGKRQTFQKTLSYYGTTQGFKKCIIHKDDRTCLICLPAWNDGWIPFQENFSNGLSQTLFHIGCRCDVVYSLVNPDNPMPEEPKKVIYQPGQEEGIVEPVVEVPDFNTVKEVDQYMTNTFFVASNMTGISPKVGNVVATALEDFNKTFPSVFKDYKIPLIKSNSRTNSRAFIRHNRNTFETVEFWLSKKNMTVGRMWEWLRADKIREVSKWEWYASEFEKRGMLKEMQEAQKYVDDLKRTGDFWTIGDKYTDRPGRANRATTMHEMWHALDNRLTNTLYKLVKLGKERPLRESEIAHLKQIRALFDKRNAAYKEFQQAIATGNNRLSHYGKTNSQEFLAESVSAYMMWEKDHLYPMIKEFLDEMSEFTTLFL